MLRKTRGDAVIKLIDFGCSEVLGEEGAGVPPRNLTHEQGATTACECPVCVANQRRVVLHRRGRGHLGTRHGVRCCALRSPRRSQVWHRRAHGTPRPAW